MASFPSSSGQQQFAPDNFRASTNAWICNRRVTWPGRETSVVCGRHNSINLCSCPWCGNVRGSGSTAIRGLPYIPEEVGCFQDAWTIRYWSEPDMTDVLAEVRKPLSGSWKRPDHCDGKGTKDNKKKDDGKGDDGKGQDEGSGSNAMAVEDTGAATT